MKAHRVRTEAGKPVEIEGTKVLYSFRLNYSDFEKLTAGLAHRHNIPFEFAVCASHESLSGIVVYGRYGSSWYTVTSFYEFIIRHMVVNFKPSIQIIKRDATRKS